MRQVSLDFEIDSQLAEEIEDFIRNKITCFMEHIINVKEADFFSDSEITIESFKRLNGYHLALSDISRDIDRSLEKSKNK